MSEIKNRTIYVDLHKKDGAVFHKISNWAHVTTEVGSMFEPHWPGAPRTDNDYEAEDSMVRIDAIEARNTDVFLGDGCIGGDLMPRLGR